VYKSAPEIIRARGGNPKDVMNQESKWRRQLAESGLSVAAAPKVATEPPDENAPEDKGNDDEQT
jgi:capsid protein